MWQFLVQFIHRLHIFIPWLFGLVSELLLPEKNIAELVQGCLLDPGFPALVAKVEELLENGYSNDVWIILRNKENQSLLLNGWEIGHSARALLGDRISSLSLKYVDLLKIGILKNTRLLCFLDILWLTILFLFLWLTNLQVATKCLQNNLNIFKCSCSKDDLCNFLYIQPYPSTRFLVPSCLQSFVIYISLYQVL